MDDGSYLSDLLLDLMRKRREEPSHDMNIHVVTEDGEMKPSSGSGVSGSRSPCEVHQSSSRR